MSFTDIFIRRPVFATVLSLIILLVGAKSYFSLPVRLYPKVDATVVTIDVTYAGADAELMEGFVTTPIENAIAGVDGIDYIRSNSSAGKSSVAVIFNLGYDINVAVSDINSKVSSVRWKLPREIDDPVVGKRDPNAQPSMYISYTSDALAPEEITDYLQRVIQPQLQTLPGVAAADVYGFPYSMQIWLNPKLMAAHKVTAGDIKAALTVNNLQSPAGPLKSAWQTLNVRTNTTLLDEQEFNDLVVKDVNGQMIRIKDVGHAKLASSEENISLVANDKKAVVIGITPGPTANPLDVSREVKKILPFLQSSMPGDLNYNITWDSSIYVDKSIEEVKKTILEATLGVIAVVFLFLGSWRVLLIPLVTIPLSLIGVCGIMLAMGYSLNTITLLALVLAIGMVVDDAIVVSENIHRHITLGNKPLDAALIGAREIKFAIISMTFTLAAVYAPIGFLTGLVGSLFKEFAFTLASAVIISGFIALTLSPMMCSKFISQNTLEGKMAHFVHHAFDKVMQVYKSFLTKVLQYRKIVVVLMLIIFGLCYFIYITIPGELAPREDVGGILVIASGPTSANLSYTEKYTQALIPIYKSVPEGKGYFIVNGMPSANNAHSFLVLKPWSERKRTAQMITKELFPKLWAIPGILAFPVSISMLPGTSGAMPVDLVIQTTGDYKELVSVVEKILEAAHANNNLVNIDTDLKLDQAQVDIKINRDKAGDMGVYASEIGDAINMALGKPTVSHFAISGRSYDVIPQIEDEYRKQPDTLNLLYLRTRSGELVPLSNLVTFEELLQPQSLVHFQQLRAAHITASMNPGYTLGQALKYFHGVTKKVVPSNMQIAYGGESRQFMQTSGTMEATFVFAIIFIFLILAAQFESFRDPFIVLFSVPLSVFGALLTLKLTGTTMSIYSEIGLVTLVGLISKHGILMVEFANQLQEQGRELKEAIIEAASIRLRPVLMTTGAMLLGALPLALATGAGAVSRQQIGWVIIGGMSIGTVFTLFVVPTMYTFLATKKKKEEKSNETESPV